MEPFSSKTVGELAREMVITVSVDYKPWNHCPAKQYGLAHDEFRHFCSRLFEYKPYSKSYRQWRVHISSWMDHGTILIAKSCGGTCSGLPQ